MLILFSNIKKMNLVLIKRLQNKKILINQNIKIVFKRLMIFVDVILAPNIAQPIFIIYLNAKK